MKGFFHFLLLIFLGFQTASCNTADEVYAKRIAAIPSAIPLTYNTQVKAQIDWLLKNENGNTARMLGRTTSYYPLIENHLAANKLPADLKYLAAAGSFLDVFYVSEEGNAGLWNMNFRVARNYNLKINTYVDERRDAIRSTEAAAHYMADLKNIYNDWLLVIAAYYAGPLEINKAIRMADGKTDYWVIEQHLPANLRIMVPRYIATVYMHHHYTDHRLARVMPKAVPESDTVTINKWLAFSQISETLGVKVEDLRTLNPIFRKDIIPYAPVPYVVRLPKDKVGKVGLLKDVSYRVVESEKDEDDIEKEFQEVIDSTAKANKDSADKVSASILTNTRVMYTVKKGENLKRIADWYDCTVFEIKEWNSLKTETLKPGQRLLIYKPKDKADYYRSINKMTPAQKKKLEDGKPK